MTTAADLVLINGVVFTADAAGTVAESVAVAQGRIVFVGASSAARAYIGPATRVIDLKGKMAAPGFLDTHMHPPGLALSRLYEVQLDGRDGLDGYLETIRAFIAAHPRLDLIYGRGWSWSRFHGAEATKGPRKEYLDAVSAEIPIIIRAGDGHTLWVNSKALAVNGVTERTISPPGGSIEKDDATGALWGTLKEAAMGLVALPAYAPAQYRRAMEAFQREMHRFGVTGLLCLGSHTFEALFEAFREMETAGGLRLRVRGAVTVDQHGGLAAQFDRIAALQARYHSLNLAITATKFFTDGVVEGVTSHLLEPYDAAAGRGPTYNAPFLWDEEALAEAFYQANRRGLQVHVHSTGDGSTRKVLDALAKVRRRLPDRGLRNAITHLQLVAPEDIVRFRELDVIASVQPYWHFKGPGWWENVDAKFLGARAEREFPLGSFFARGVVVASSSDYPATLTPNPLYAIDIGATRNLDRGDFYGVPDLADMDDPRWALNPAERATVEQMLRSFTINGAYLLRLEREIGSIERGKRADLVVLDRDLLAAAPPDIDQARVLRTFFEGEEVYRSEAAAD